MLGGNLSGVGQVRRHDDIARNLRLGWGGEPKIRHRSAVGAARAVSSSAPQIADQGIEIAGGNVKKPPLAQIIEPDLRGLPESLQLT